jgi:hypothetical protein
MYEVTMKIKSLILLFMISLLGFAVIVEKAPLNDVPKNSPSPEASTTAELTLKDIGLSFSRATPDTKALQENNGTIKVITNETRRNYQLVSNSIPISESNKFKITYEVSLKKGGFGVGLLSADQSKWVVRQHYKTPGNVRGIIELPKESPEKAVFLVFSNNSPDAQRSIFEIKKLTLNK